MARTMLLVFLPRKVGVRGVSVQVTAERTCSDVLRPHIIFQDPNKSAAQVGGEHSGSSKKGQEKYKPTEHGGVTKEGEPDKRTKEHVGFDLGKGLIGRN